MLPCSRLTCLTTICVKKNNATLHELLEACQNSSAFICASPIQIIGHSKNVKKAKNGWQRVEGKLRTWRAINPEMRFFPDWGRGEISTPRLFEAAFECLEKYFTSFVMERMSVRWWWRHWQRARFHGIEISPTSNEALYSLCVSYQRSQKRDKIGSYQKVLLRDWTKSKRRRSSGKECNRLS